MILEYPMCKAPNVLIEHGPEILNEDSKFGYLPPAQKSISNVIGLKWNHNSMPSFCLKNEGIF